MNYKRVLEIIEHVKAHYATEFFGDDLTKEECHEIDEFMKTRRMRLDRLSAEIYRDCCDNLLNILDAEERELEELDID